MRITLITLFPEMARAVTDFGVTRRAVENGQLVLDTVNPRDFTEDRHRTVDDRPFGGGPGMVMKVAPLEKALVLIDAVTRLLPGVLGHQDSAAQDSFSGDMENLLDCPHYTRPELYQGRSVPEVLLSGDHERIRRWRLKQALGRTWRWRPELLEARRERGLSKEESELLDEYIREFEARDDGQQYSDQ